MGKLTTSASLRGAKGDRTDWKASHSQEGLAGHDDPEGISQRGVTVKSVPRMRCRDVERTGNELLIGHA
ncbi:MAG: hypothetical protein C0504_10680 [Candidatus Solibacter sp.]|nr:hypothetical protein [Candidatus Solibacter sp.]